MSSLSTDLSSRRRPALLIDTARQAARRLEARLGEGAESRRPRLRPGGELMELEDKLDLARRTGQAGYSAHRHIMVLAALIVHAGMI